ncbi:30S ribosomal protein S6 [Candidatus Sumerlaeota bacterium]|nr:30S ribosomal protein S6 [Candidatus Sumerlaeota bacterium]
MATYELVAVIDGQRSDEEIDALLTKIDTLISEGGAEITHTDNWGKRRLAYPIDGKVDGFYAIRQFVPGKAVKPIVDELDHLVRIDEALLRHMVTRLPKKKKPLPIVGKPEPTKDARPDWGGARRGWRPPRPPMDREHGDRDRPPRMDSPSSDEDDDSGEES